MPPLLHNRQELSPSPSLPYTLPRRRRVRIILFITISTISLVFLILFGLSAHPQTCEYARTLFRDDPDLKFDPNSTPPNILALGPPKYDSIRAYEKNLPQHNLLLRYPEGKEGRYVKFSNQVKFMGWNNCLNEFTPLNAIIAGPTAGGVWDPNDPAPRSISSSWFDIVCPAHERRIINTREIKPNISGALGNEVFDTWKKVLQEAPERCIEIQAPESYKEDTRPQTFDERLWLNYTRLESLWEIFLDSPTSRLLQPSPLVLSAVYKNEYLFLPPHPSSRVSPASTPWDRMMAIHLRKGDFEDHCMGLWTVKLQLYGWNALAFLPDRFTPGSIGLEEHMKHCWPSVDDIVAKVRKARSDYLSSPSREGDAVLDVMYLLTNDHSGFVNQIIDVLGNEGWVIRTTKDLTLDQEQTDVSMAVDMEIASKSQGVYSGRLSLVVLFIDA